MLSLWLSMLSSAPPLAPPSAPPSAPPPALPGWCDNTCSGAWPHSSSGPPDGYYTDGHCADGGPGSVTPGAFGLPQCALGTDCADCGVRTFPPSPPSLPPQLPGTCDNTCMCDNKVNGDSPDAMDCPCAIGEICAWPYSSAKVGNGECNDGGSGAEFHHCMRGTDVTSAGLESWSAVACAHSTCFPSLTSVL